MPPPMTATLKAVGLELTDSVSFGVLPIVKVGLERWGRYYPPEKFYLAELKVREHGVVSWAGEATA